MNTETNRTGVRPGRKRNSVRRRLAQAALAAGTAVGVVAAMTTPAHAAVSTCTIWWPGPGNCTTGAVKPHPNAWVDWRVAGGTGATGWRMYDAGNGVTVASGTVQAGQTRSGTVFGLYSGAGYKIRITSSYLGYATVENELP
jgi:hypothetical protein